MYLADYHIHTHYSFDSEAKLEEICQNALARGMDEIALTDHMDFAAGKSFRDILDCKKWYAELLNVKRKYAGKLIVRFGIEAGTPQYNPEEFASFYEKYPLDFIIGSVHNTQDNTDIGNPYFYEVNYKKIYEEYNTLLIELAKNYEYDVLGHLTYPSRYIEKQLGIEVDVHTYTDFYMALFHVLKERGKGIELNTSGIARGGKRIMPPLWLLRLYGDCGGEIVTIGTDSHVADQVGTTIEFAKTLLKQSGFSYYAVYTNHKINMKKI